ncbi:MAG TPA: hypothetical protein VFW92_08575 [Candidatus Limnocylindrales bacterium]|nr:hypothetical protein [Candidatus Limnocylindrales bacterium]
MDRPAGSRTTTTKALTPLQAARQKQQRQFKRMINSLHTPDDVFEVRLGLDDKPLTVRQRLLRAAQEEGKDIAVRKHDTGFVVGLMTPERRSRRGRRRASAA